MAYLENNSTNKLLFANQEFLGTTVEIPADFVAAQVSFNVAGSSGRLEFLHSYNGVTFQNYGDIFDFEPGEHARQVSLKAQFFRVKYINGNANQTNFHLHTRIGKGGAFDDMNVNIDYRYDSISVVAGGTGLNTRLLTTSDEITIPSLDACITGNNIGVVINGGSLVIGSDSNIHASNGDILTATSGSLNTNITNLSSLTLSSTTSSITIPALTSAKDSISVSGNVGLVSGSSVSVSNQITGYATSALQTTGNNLLTDIKNKTINKTTDSIDITNQNINVNPRIESSNYDLLNNGATLWADTTPLVNPFFADLNGREGWYYQNSGNILNKSNIYWYANPTAGSLQENDMTFSQLTNMYSVFTCDYVDNGELTVPFLGLYSQPTGTNDFIPTFAHSRWVYQLNNTNLSKLRKGETILVYTGSTRPSVYNELASYQLNLVSQNGDASPSEIIAYMTVNTQATTSLIGYLLQFCGYFNSNVGFNKQYGFQNSKNRVIQNSLYAGLATEITLNDIKYKTDYLTFYNEVGQNELMTYDRASETNLIEIKNNTDGLTYSDILGITGSSSLNTFDLTNYQKISGIETYTSKLNNITYTDNNLNVNISNPSEGITGYSLQSTQLDVLSGITGINQTIIDKHLNSSTDSITVNTISGFNLESTQLDVLKGITGINQTIIDKHLNSSTDSITVNTISGFNLESTQLNVLSGITGLNQTIIDKTLSKLTSSIDISGQSVNVNTISGFALETGGNLALIKTNTDNLDNLTFTGNDLNVKFSNFPAGVTGVVSINNFPSGFNVNNQPTDYPISAGGAYLDAVNQSLFVNLRDVSGNAYGVSANPLYVNNTNNITGYATETTLSSIKTQTDKLNFNGLNLKTQIMNSSLVVESGSTPLTIQSGTNPIVVASGVNPLEVNVVAGNLPADGKAYLYSGNGVTPITQTTISTKSGIDSNIINSSIDTHCYGSTNGTNWHHLKTDANGILNIHSMTQDGSGIDITSTLNGVSKQSLDVNVSNISAIPVSGTVSLSSGSVIKISDGVDTANVVQINTSMLASQEKGLATVSAVYGAVFTPGGSLTSSQPITMTNITEAVIDGKNALDTYDFRVDAKLTTVNTKLDTINTSVGTTNTTLTSTNTKLDTINTSIGTGNTTLSAISSKMVTQANSGATVGLNVYNIYPNRLIYRMSGNTATTITGQFLAPDVLNFSASSIAVGLNYPRTFNIYATSAINKNVDVEYIDANGNLANLNNIAISNVSTNANLTNAININRLNWSPTSGNGNNTATIYAKDTGLGVYRNSLSAFNSGAGIITCPNGYVGIVSQLYYNSAVGDDLQMIVRDKYNNIKTTRYMAAAIGTAVGRYFNIGDINEPLFAGDSVYFMSALPNSGARYYHAIVTLEAL